MSELKPCPCDGCKGKLWGNGSAEVMMMKQVDWMVMGECGVSTKWHKKKEDAIKHWNTRPANLVVCPTEEKLSYFIAKKFPSVGVYYDERKIAKALLSLLRGER